MALEINFFGRFAIGCGGKWVGGFESDKVRLLLAYLVLEAGRPQRREGLVGLFWPGSSERRARQSLSQALYNLRSVLEQAQAGEYLEITAKDACFVANDEVVVDVASFSSHVEAVNRHAHTAAWACRVCQERLAAAAGLYNGELLKGFSLPDSPEFEAWLDQQRYHLQAQARDVFAKLIHGLLRRGERQQALEYARRLVDMDPFDETNQRQWISLLGQAGKRAEALNQFAQFKHLLAAELVTEPEAETIRLAEHIRQANQPGSAEALPKHNLPSYPTAFVGRETEIDGLYWKLLDPGCRLLTLLGLGGSGKTRLAVEMGRKILPAFADGAFMVELGVLSSPHDLVPAIIRTLGVKPKAFKDQVNRPAQVQDLMDYFSQKELLLILDSAEMVVDGAKVLSDLLTSTPGLTILATSRSRLNLSGENLVQLAGLQYPLDQGRGWEESAAVKLFTQAAQRSSPEFKLSEQNASAVIQICGKLQGMPLAILLAAAWTSAMSPERILLEINTNLEFLAGSWQDLPSRQKSLRAAFDYSWGFLWEEERAVLQRLAIFRQPFSADQAKEVAGATPNSLRALLDFSLIQPTGHNRLRMHDLVRQFALEKLSESPEESFTAHTLLGRLYLRQLGAWNISIKSARQVEAFQELDQEIENASLAWEWLVRQKQEPGMAAALEGLCLTTTGAACFSEVKTPARQP